MTAHAMTCDRFEGLLGDFLEEVLDAATRAACEAHRTTCPACAALVADLDAIVAAAATLPPPEPSRDLWPAIEARLGTSVLDLAAAREARPARALPPVAWRRLAVAAAALVMVSAGVTWSLATRAPSTAASAGTTATDASPRDLAAPVTVALDGRTTTAPLSETPADGAVTGATASLAAYAPDARPLGIDTLYGREIALLRAAADDNLGRLDSSTVAVIRRNLDIIDQAIRESREALRADPKSGFLLEQLDHAYERKVELLRRLAML